MQVFINLPQHVDGTCACSRFTLAASTRLVSGRVEYVRLFGVGWSERETTCACQKLDNLFLHALETPACNSTGPEPMFSLKCKEFLGMPHAFFKEDTRSAEPLYLRLELGGPRQKTTKFLSWIIHRPLE